jgi:hypothetical protein
MDIFVKAFIAALLATVAAIGLGRAGLKPNDLRNYPNLRPQTGPANGIPGMADIDPQSKAAQAAADPLAKAPQGPMTQGQEAAAESGFSTELENPNK